MNPNYLNQALTQSQAVRDVYSELTFRYVHRNKGILDPYETKELASFGLLDEADKPRPLPTLIANQTTVILHTYHRCRVPPPTRKTPGAWTPHLRAIPLTPHIASILLNKFRGNISPASRKNLERVANGWKSRQRKPKTILQAQFA